MATFNFEQYEHDCREVVKRIHETAIALSELEQQSQLFIGGKYIARECNEAAMTLYVMENRFAVEIFELGDN